jgi:N-methylhydantoinase B
MTNIDPVTLAVLVNNLHWIAEEMGVYLVRSGFSTNIKVRRDCSCALYTKDGDMLAQGEFIPVHLGVMAQAVKEIIKDHPLDTLKDGDSIIHNDPFRMGSHLPDVMIFKPIFYEGNLIAWAGSLAHQVDIGGSPLMFIVPTVLEEGLRLPPIKIIKEGVIQKDIMDIIIANSRTPYDVKGDLMAQTAANYRGEQRLLGLVRKYGVKTILDYFNAVLDYSERGMRQAIEDIPDGESSFEDYLETDGIEDALIKIKIKLVKKGSDIYLDFAGSGKPGNGGVNSPWSLTHSAAYYAIKAVVGPKVPTNGGAYRPIHLLRPEGESIVDAKFPHAISGCTGTVCQRIVDVLIGAFSKMVPEKVCACASHWLGIWFIGIDPRTGRYSAYSESYGAGLGAKYNDDGADGHHVHMTNTANACIEIIELEHPVKVEKYALVDDSGGAGKYRGGVGMTREITTLTEGSGNVLIMRQKVSPYGLFGGQDGSVESGGVVLTEDKTVRFSKNIKAGTRIYVRTGGGGGWGDPMERDVDKVEWDALNGYISLESARDKYGCIIDPVTHKIDLTGTREQRNKIKAARVTVKKAVNENSVAAV